METVVTTATTNDFDDIYAIENSSFDEPWSDRDIGSILCNNNSFCLVVKTAIINDVVTAGFLIATIINDKIVIEDIAVKPELRLNGFGLAMIYKLIEIAKLKKCETIQLVTTEYNTGSHLFWKSAGFTAVSICKEYFEDRNGLCQDGYEFELQINEPERKRQYFHKQSDRV